MHESTGLTVDPYWSIFFDMKDAYDSGARAESQNLSRLFAALGDDERQRIVLSFPPGRALNVSQIARASTLSRPTVSHHLKRLCEAGVLERSRQGREIHFRLRATALIENLQAVIGYLEAHR